VHLHQLEAFLVLAEEGNYRRAAKRLLLSQPGLSEQIRGLERELGVRLFDRNRAGTNLSAKGASLLPLTVTAVGAVRDLVAAAGGRATSGVRRRRLTVGLFIDGAGELTWPVLEVFRNARPDVDIVLRTMSFADTFSAVRDGSVDVALLRGPVTDDDVEVISLGWCPVVVAVSAGHAFADAPRLEMRDVVDELAYEVPMGLDPTMRNFWLQADLHDGASPRLRLRSKDRTDLDDCTHDVSRAGTVSLFPLGSPIAPGPECVFRPLASPLHAPVQVVSRRHDSDALAFLEIAAAVSTDLLPMCRFLVPAP
jgi:DNA-binding transcriptional LysR family regulator